MSKDSLLLSHIMDIKEAVARLEQRLVPLEEGVKKGTEAHSRVEKLEAKLGTIWATIIAIPTIAAILAVFGFLPVDINPRNNPPSHNG